MKQGPQSVFESGGAEGKMRGIKAQFSIKKAQNNFKMHRLSKSGGCAPRRLRGTYY